MKKEDNSSGVASVILGLVSLSFALSILPSIFSLSGLFLGVIGLVFGMKQRKAFPSKWSTWGIALSILGIAINTVLLVFLIMTIAQTLAELQSSGLLDQLQNVPQ